MLGITYGRKSGKEPVQAVIKNIDSQSRSFQSVEREVIVEFEYGGEIYTGVLDGYDSTMYIRKVIEIYVDPDNPSDFTDGSGLVPIIFIVISGCGFVLLLILPR